MSLKDKQNVFEMEYSIEIVSSSKGEYFAQIADEQGQLVWEQRENSETRSDALDIAEAELEDMFQLYLDDQE